jgi:hypothetical protein
MKTDERKQKNDTIRLFAMKEYLAKSADIGPSRLAVEQRRLLTAVEREKAGVQRRRSKSMKWVAAVAAAAAMILVIVGVRILLKPTLTQSSTPLTLSGLVQLKSGEALLSGNTATVPSSEGAKIVWPDHTAVWLRETSKIRVAETGEDTVELSEGRLLATVTPRAHAKPFVAKTPLGRVTVHGTVFSVSVNASHVVVRLYEGAVTFAYQGSDLSLRPGSELDVRKGKEPVIRPMDDTGVLADLMIGEKTATLEGPPLPLFGRDKEMPAATEAGAPALPKPSNTSTSRRPDKKPARNPKPSVPETRINESLQSTDSFVDPSLNDIEVKRVKESSMTAEDEDPTSHIESLMRQGDYEDCIALTDEYLKKFPSGTYAERIQYLKGCCETKAGDLKAGREAFERYLIQFPEGRQWKRVHQILGE